MKHTKAIIGSIIFLTSGALNVVHAQDLGNFGFPNPTNYENLEQLINTALSLLRPVFVITFTAMIIYAAWVWLTSQGNEDKVASARRIIIAAVIGFAVAVLAPVIVSILISFLGVQNLDTL